MASWYARLASWIAHGSQGAGWAAVLKVGAGPKSPALCVYREAAVSEMCKTSGSFLVSLLVVLGFHYLLLHGPDFVWDQLAHPAQGQERGLDSIRNLSAVIVSGEQKGGLENFDTVEVRQVWLALGQQALHPEQREQAMTRVREWAKSAP